jgi:hypothetical protein
MKVNTFYIGTGVYVRMETASRSMNMLVEEGKTPVESLQSSADEFRRKAKRLRDLAVFVEEAILVLSSGKKG